MVNAYPSDWSQPHEIVLKLREPGVKTRHHGGTALACEMLTAMWGRMLGFDVPDYAIVKIRESFADSVVDEEVRKRLHGSLGLNFGTAYLESCRTWPAEQRRPLGSDLEALMSQLLQFDSTVLNSDRTRETPNLLWDGTNCYPIDHSLALGVHRKSSQSYESFLEEPRLSDREMDDHVARQLLRWRNLDFDSVAETWKNLPVDEILTEMRDVLPDEWESESGDFDRIFDFLSRRENHFGVLVDQLQRVVS